jgi:hypothetical protein
MKAVSLKSKRALATTLLICACVILLDVMGCQAEKAAGTVSGDVETIVGDTAPADASFVWSTSSDCAACHISHEDSRMNPSSLMRVHEENDCVTCHADEEGLATVHDGLTLSDKPVAKTLRKTDVSEQTCIGCHGNWDTLESQTSDVVLLTDIYGTTVNPHSAKTPDYNNNGNHDEITCSDCHKMHAVEGIEATAPRTCLRCHHQDVYECNTCHET